MAWRIAQHFPQVERLFPTAGKDWNEHLTGNRRAVPKRSEMADLWRWYQAASTINRSEKYLSRIREVAVAFVEGDSLSNKAKIAMKRDLNKISQKSSSYFEVSV